MDDLSTLLAEYNVLAAFWMTIKLTVAGRFGALMIGTLVAVLRVSPVGVSYAPPERRTSRWCATRR